MAPAEIQERSPATPFGPASSAVVLGRVGQTDVALLQRHGPGHRFNPSAVPYRANIWALRSVGCTHIVASGACGSLREEVRPGELVLVDQFVDRTIARPRSLFDAAAVHVEFADPCCPVTRAWLAAAASTLGLPFHQRGTYVCIEGPSFSTRAEAAMHRTLGCDIVGMTALPEARLAREAEMGYALLALPTDDDCWRDRPVTSHESLLAEIRANLTLAVQRSITLIKAALADSAILRTRPSSAAGVLDQALWTEEAALASNDRERLSALKHMRRD